MLDTERSSWRSKEDSAILGAQLSLHRAATASPYQCGDYWGPGNRFLLKQILGCNARGFVYLAVDTQMSDDGHDAQVVIKLRQEGPGRREAVRYRRASHDSVACVFDCGIFGAWHYTITEYIEGTSLDDLETPVHPRKAARLAIEIAHGIAAIHNVLLVHADLKPENILMTEEGKVKIIDFDLASDIGTMDVLGGNVAFLAPERFEDECAPTVKSDVYALGGLLYWMLSGKSPNGQSMEHAQAYATGERERDYAQLPAGLRRIVAKALSPDPEHRITSASELSQAIEDWLALRSPRGIETPSLTRAGLLFRRRPFRSCVALCTLIGTLAAMIFILHTEQYKAIEAAKRLAETNAYTKDLQVRADHLLRAMTSRSAGWGVLPAYVWLDIFDQDPLLGEDGEITNAHRKRDLLRDLVESQSAGTMNHDLARYTLAYMIAANSFHGIGALEEFDALVQGLGERWLVNYENADTYHVGLDVLRYCRAMHDPSIGEQEFRRLAYLARDRVFALPTDAIEVLSFKKTIQSNIFHVTHSRGWLTE